ncbi:MULTISPECIES: type II toxin-antitoxin system MqsR family toxin [unclassified Thiocapsa]|uniref:type II toxin-antitoxin system MqsR family toxin n=1 Tax=unclassified Thiocapsa TaxID=2641286 RepID=UPI0035B03DFE
MEKRTPHCRLSFVKALIDEGKVRMTQSAIIGGRRLGFDADGILATVLALAPADFYKSMRTHADHRIWQDVYHATTSVGEVYVKLTVIDDVLIVSFKEL